TSVNGTLGYSGTYTVVSQAQGTITALPAVGQTISQGQMLFEVDGKPVVLLYGDKPAYRSLAIGDTGADVVQLNADLVALGDATGCRVLRGNGGDGRVGECVAHGACRHHPDRPERDGKSRPSAGAGVDRDRDGQGRVRRARQRAVGARGRRLRDRNRGRARHS